MSVLTATVPYPAQADPSPVAQVALDLRGISTGLNNAGEQFRSLQRLARAEWVGEASVAFQHHLTRSSGQLHSTAGHLVNATYALQQFAAAINSTRAAHMAAAELEAQAIAAAPDGENARQIAVQRQAAAVQALHRAAETCARSLNAVTQEIARANRGPVPLRRQGPEFRPLERRYTPTGPRRDWREAAGSAGDNLNAISTYGIGPLTNGLDGYLTGVGRGLEHNTVRVNMRNGTSYTRWKPNVGGPQLGLTAGQAAIRLEALKRWGRIKIPVLGAGIDATVQVLEDQRDPSLTSEQRVTRVASAVVLQGAGGAAGAALGAKGGAAIGAAVGVWFGGVGAVPGAVIGGIIGGIAGGFVGSGAGGWVKNKLFKLNPGRWFRSGKRRR